MSIQDAATLIGITRQRLWQMIDDGGVQTYTTEGERSYKIGNKEVLRLAVERKKEILNQAAEIELPDWI